jgi:alkylation response protein AidB-like acyl-CoA dehydrogenase
MFELTKSQKEIQNAAKDFAKGEFGKESAYELEKSNAFPINIWKKAAELGFIGIHFSEDYSGGGMGFLENSLIIEELCRNDPSIGSAVAQSSNGAELLHSFGSESLKTEYLPRVVEGHLLSAKAFTESEIGGDYTSIITRAAQTGEYWELKGNKKHVINGGKAGFYIVLCRTGREDEPIEKSLSMVLVDAEVSGIRSKSYGKRLGNNMVSVSELTFDNVRVPKENLLGVAGQGYTQLKAYLNEERLNIAAQAIGNALASYDRMLTFVKGREQFGKKIASFQVSKHKIADMATKIELSRLILHKAAWLLDNNKANRSLCSMAKMAASRTAMEVGAQAIQLFGGYGYMAEYEVERFYREAKALEIREGTSSIQKDIIADAAIGRIK